VPARRCCQLLLVLSLPKALPLGREGPSRFRQADVLSRWHFVAGASPPTSARDPLPDGVPRPPVLPLLHSRSLRLTLLPACSPTGRRACGPTSLAGWPVIRPRVRLVLFASAPAALSATCTPSSLLLLTLLLLRSCPAAPSCVPPCPPARLCRRPRRPRRRHRGVFWRENNTGPSQKERERRKERSDETRDQRVRECLFITNGLGQRTSRTCDPPARAACRRARSAREWHAPPGRSLVGRRSGGDAKAGMPASTGHHAPCTTPPHRRRGAGARRTRCW